MHDDKIIVQNNRQPIRFPGESTGLGLSNLNERYRILVHEEIDIEKSETTFTVKLPLLPA
jgi:hypothetical protein